MLYNKEPNEDQNKDSSPKNSKDTPYDYIGVFKDIINSQKKSKKLLENYVGNNVNNLLLRHQQYINGLSQIKSPTNSAIRKSIEIPELNKILIKISNKTESISLITGIYSKRHNKLIKEIARHKKAAARMFIALDAHYTQLNKEEGEYNNLLNKYSLALIEHERQQKASTLTRMLTRMFKWIKLN